MILFYGLGNNEKKYLQTKHNSGRWVVEKMASNSAISNQKLYYTKSKWLDEEVYFLWSSGYMNNSGDPLRDFFKFFKIEEEGNLLVLVHDDSDQLEGKHKLVFGGGSGGQKGVQSVYSQILNFGFSPDKILRLKIGIRPLQNKQKSETFVLKNACKEEFKNWAKLAEQIEKCKELFVNREFDKLQTQINSLKS